MSAAPIAPERRHTLHFLDEIRDFSPVFLDTEVDMSAVRGHREAAKAAGERYSLVTYVLHAAARVLAEHPEANAAIRRGRGAKVGRYTVARYTAVNGKLALDQTVNGRRVVLSAVLYNLQQSGLAEIQRKVDRYRGGDAVSLPEFAGVRLLHRLPFPVGARLFRLGVRPLSRRAAVFGTFAVTSLGHRPVDGFHSVGGTTITLGMGQVADRPVVRGGEIVSAPVMRLSLAFDHRVIDGAEAADVLAEIKAGLERFDPEDAVGGGGQLTDREPRESARNDVEELKQYVVVHARAQNLPADRVEELLGRIENDDEDAPGSWVEQWSGAAREAEARGRFLEAGRYYNMARFPFVNGPARRAALAGCADSFERWAARRADVQRLDVQLPGGRVRCWTTGLSATDRRPLLLVLGGIVSVKEQWAPVLLQAARMGMAGLVTEMPGVGENTLGYGPESWRMLSGLLDAVADRADVAQTYAITLSFSGHLALRCAVEDRRIRGIVTAGAPVSGFFTDPAWQERLPRVTVDTLSHLTGIKESDFAEQLAPWALTGEQLDALDIPVHYVASGRDEIIPAGETDLLRRHVRGLRLMENDDVHGSPNYSLETRLWILRSVLRMRGIRGAQPAMLAGLSGMVRARRRLRGGVGPDR